MEHSRTASDRTAEGVLGFLERYARALTSGDSEAVAGMWEAPALVLGHADLAVGNGGEIERLFAGAKADYAARGIVETRPVIEREDWLSDRLALVDVCWPYLGDRGQTLGTESSTYVLRRDEHGALRIRVALTRDAAAASGSNAPTR